MALEPFVQALERRGVAYRVTGSLASSALGVGRTTFDVDVVADLTELDLPALAEDLRVEYLADLELMRESWARGAAFNLIHLETMLKLDVFPVKTREYDRVAFGRSARLAVSGLVFFSPEDVILSKLEWFEADERGSERQWNDILGVIRVQADALDLAYLRRWAVALALSHLLERALIEALA